MARFQSLVVRLVALISCLQINLDAMMAGKWEGFTEDDIKYYLTLEPGNILDNINY